MHCTTSPGRNAIMEPEDELQARSGGTIDTVNRVLLAALSMWHVTRIVQSASDNVDTRTSLRWGQPAGQQRWQRKYNTETLLD